MKSLALKTVLGDISFDRIHSPGAILVRPSPPSNVFVNMLIKNAFSLSLSEIVSFW